MMTTMTHESSSLSQLTETANRIVQEVEKAIVGKRETVQDAVIALLSGGHLLIEDIPGVGKTTLAKALAQSIGGEFRRIQFTPDLLPADITGSSIFNQKSTEFDFRPGPVFGNVVLADEINRATPKTQSALLEAMEERQVTSDGVTRRLPEPFFVIATQNSVELTGTYPLPEAQMDRFFMRVAIGYPSKENEVEILSDRVSENPLDRVGVVATLADILALQREVKNVFVHESVRQYIVDIVQTTRSSGLLAMGASPRGSLHLMRAAQAKAAMDGSDYVRPDEVKELAVAVLAHRVIPRGESRARGVTADDIIGDLVDSVAAPVPV